ncbi:fimbrial protein [Escherichia coli]|nr:fimbrial protein [Escherichia coli]
MKKTLIALAVAASAVVSGSAMAWTASGDGGNVNVGGTLTPVDKVIPWEVKVGAAVTGLDANIEKGQKEVSIAVNKAIPVLGIRTQTNNVIEGNSAGGVSPQISYGDALNPQKFRDGVTSLTLDVKDENKTAKIGSLTVDFTAAGVISWKHPGGNGGAHNAYANSAGHMFFGGIGLDQAGVSGNSVNIAKSFFSEVGDNFNSQGYEIANKDYSSLGVNGATYSGYYASGIQQGKTIKITLDESAGADEIPWKATLPVTVSYQ